MGHYDAIEMKLKNGGFVRLDGGIGTEIVKRGVRWRWHGLRTDSNTIKQIHQDYITANADVITTNTFQLTKRLYLNVFHDVEHMRRIGAPGLETRAEELTKLAVQLARQAVKDSSKPVAIAGSVAPIQHCFRPDLAPPFEEAIKEHRETTQLLADCGVDILLLETMNNIAEAKAAATAAKETGLPVWLSFIPNDKGNILNGEEFEDAMPQLENIGVDCVLVNCAPPEDIFIAVQRLKGCTTLPIGGYAHIGHFNPPSWKFEFHPQFSDVEEWSADRFVKATVKWQEAGAQVVGGCCGTGPEHIKELNSLKK